jgi:hypothetical protein
MGRVIKPITVSVAILMALFFAYAALIIFVVIIAQVLAYLQV